MKQLLIAGYPENTANYRAAFERLGAAVTTLPTELPPDYFHGLVLPGGGDIAPHLFRAPDLGSRNIEEELDRIQLSLLAFFVKKKKPVLGICKGLQLINVFFGGGILQDLPAPSLEIHAYETADKRHRTRAAAGTFPALLYGRTPFTNSAHHQGCGALGEGLLVAQYAPDFVVEALYHRSLPLLAVQWHPERMCFAHRDAQLEDGSLLLRYFLSLL